MGYFIFLSEKFLLRRVKRVISRWHKQWLQLLCRWECVKSCELEIKCSKNNFPSVWNLFDGIYIDFSIISMYAIYCIRFQCLMILEYHWKRKGLLSLLAPGISPWAITICYTDTCNFFYVCACCTVQDYYFLHDSLLLLVFVVVEEPLLKKRKITDD